MFLFFIEINNSFLISSLGIVQPENKTQNVGEQYGCAESGLQACNLVSYREEWPPMLHLRSRMNTHGVCELQTKLTCAKINHKHFSH